MKFFKKLLLLVLSILLMQPSFMSAGNVFSGPAATQESAPEAQQQETKEQEREHNDAASDSSDEQEFFDADDRDFNHRGLFGGVRHRFAQAQAAAAHVQTSAQTLQATATQAQRLVSAVNATVTPERLQTAGNALDALADVPAITSTLKTAAETAEKASRRANRLVVKNTQNINATVAHMASAARGARNVVRRLHTLTEQAQATLATAQTAAQAANETAQAVTQAATSVSTAAQHADTVIAPAAAAVDATRNGATRLWQNVTHGIEGARENPGKTLAVLATAVGAPLAVRQVIRWWNNPGDAPQNVAELAEQLEQSENDTSAANQPAGRPSAAQVLGLKNYFEQQLILKNSNAQEKQILQAAYAAVCSGNACDKDALDSLGKERLSACAARYNNREQHADVAFRLLLTLKMSDESVINHIKEWFKVGTDAAFLKSQCMALRCDAHTKQLLLNVVTQLEAAMNAKNDALATELINTLCAMFNI